MNFSRTIIRGFAAPACKGKSPGGAGGSGGGGGEIHPGYFALKKKQERFQKNDGKPIFLKAGFMDQVLYRSTLGLCIIAIGAMAKTLYDFSLK